MVNMRHRDTGTLGHWDAGTQGHWDTGTLGRRSRHAIVCALAAMAASAIDAIGEPVVSNVSAAQREGTKLVDIAYDVENPGGGLLRVSIEASDDDGGSWTVPSVSLSGDAGDNVEPGAGKHVVWDAGADWGGEYSDKMRVKVVAVASNGFPGVEWSDEIQPGGFLMGQDGGAEGAGPSRQVEIPWSYWLSKDEITVGQFCEFLNLAHSLGKLARCGYSSVWATAGSGIVSGVDFEVPLAPIGDQHDIRWNAMRYEVVGGRTNYPAMVTWYGAKAFAEMYGCDLPCDAEWERAARGPDHEDFGTHRLYPWGDDFSPQLANADPSTLLPVGSFPETAYGLRDIVGNAPEWTSTGAGLQECSALYDRNPTYSKFPETTNRHKVASESSITSQDVESPSFYYESIESSKFNPVHFRYWADPWPTDPSIVRGGFIRGEFMNWDMAPIFSRLAAPKVSAMVFEDGGVPIEAPSAPAVKTYRQSIAEATTTYGGEKQFSGVFSHLEGRSLVSVWIDIGTNAFVSSGNGVLIGNGGSGIYNSSGWAITLNNAIPRVNSPVNIRVTYDVEWTETETETETETAYVITSYSFHLANLSPRYSGGGCYSSESMTVDEEAGTVFQTMDFSYGTVDSQSQFLGRWPSLGNSSRNLSIVVENDSTGESFLFIDDGKGKLSGPAGSGFYNDIAWSVQLSSPQSGSVSASVMRTCDNSTTSSNTYSTIHADSWCIPGAIDFDSLNGFRIVRRAGEGLNRPSTDLPDDSGIDGNGE